MDRETKWKRYIFFMPVYIVSLRVRSELKWTKWKDSARLKREEAETLLLKLELTREARQGLGTTTRVTVSALWDASSLCQSVTFCYTVFLRVRSCLTWIRQFRQDQRISSSDVSSLWNQLSRLVIICWCTSSLFGTEDGRSLLVGLFLDLKVLIKSENSG